MYNNPPFYYHCLNGLYCKAAVLNPRPRAIILHILEVSPNLNDQVINRLR